MRKWYDNTIKRHLAKLLMAIFAISSIGYGFYFDYNAEVIHRSELLLKRNAGIFAALMQEDFLLVEEVTNEIADTASNEAWKKWTSNSVLVTRVKTPYIRHILLFDKDGNQRYVNFTKKPPNINIVEREYFKKLKDGEETTYYGPYIGKNTGKLSYAFARRLEGKNDAFDGLILTALNLEKLAEVCNSTLESNFAELVLLSADRKLIAGCSALAGFYEFPTNFNMPGKIYKEVKVAEGKHNLIVVSIIDRSLMSETWLKKILLQLILFLAGTLILLELYFMEERANTRHRNNLSKDH